jgi:phosphoglycerol transferase
MDTPPHADRVDPLHPEIFLSQRWWQKEWVREAAAYLLTAGITLGLLVCSLQLWKADLWVPLEYRGDALFTAMQVRTILDNDWYLHNPRLGAPFGCEMHDFPLPETVHFLALKGLGLCGCDAFLAINLYFFLGFPLAALTAFFVCRHFGGRRLPALVAGVLFAFAPYHFVRHVSHFFLSAYFLVPLMVMVVLWVYREPELLFIWGKAGRLACRPRRWRVVAGVLVCLLVAGGGVYYAFFGCFFLGVAGLLRSAQLRRLAPLASAACFIAVVVAGVVAQLAPNFLYHREHGPNLARPERLPIEAELHGFRIAQLVLPVQGHRWSVLRDLRARYDLFHDRTEGYMATFGLVGAAGFLFLLARVFVRLPRTENPELADGLTYLNGAGLLLGTVGGLGSLFALLVSPEIRGYSRVSIYLAFFALFAGVILAETLYRRWDGTAWGRWLLRAGLLLLLVMGFLDEKAPPGHLAYAEHRDAYQNDLTFVAAIESRLPAGSMVFQLPYNTFPGGPTQVNMLAYDHFRVYLASKTLRWSYGAMWGRNADSWYAATAALPPQDLVAKLAAAGFSGIYINRDGHADDASALEKELGNVLHAKPLQSGDGRMLFFDLTAYTSSPRAADRLTAP